MYIADEYIYGIRSSSEAWLPGEHTGEEVPLSKSCIRKYGSIFYIGLLWSCSACTN